MADGEVRSGGRAEGQGLPVEGGVLRNAEALRGATQPGEEGKAEAASYPSRMIQHDEVAVLLARRLQQAWEGAMEELTQGALALALEAAEALVRKTVETDRDMIARVLREALEEVVSQGTVEAHVNPADVASAREMVARLRGVPRPRVVADEDIAPGGCLVTTDFGNLDATVEAQLERLRRALGGEE